MIFIPLSSSLLISGNCSNLNFLVFSSIYIKGSSNLVLLKSFSYAVCNSSVLSLFFLSFLSIFFIINLVNPPFMKYFEELTK